MHIYETNVKILYGKIWCVKSKYYKLKNKNKNKKSTCTIQCPSMCTVPFI